MSMDTDGALVVEDCRDVSKPSGGGAESPPPPLNDDWLQVYFGETKKYTVYCGVAVDHNDDEQSDLFGNLFDGCLDPGPQCLSCARLQSGPARLGLLRRLFPNLGADESAAAAVAVAALRAGRGVISEAAERLRELGAHEVEGRHALPRPYRRGGGSEANKHRRTIAIADDEDEEEELYSQRLFAALESDLKVKSLAENFGVSEDIAMAALRKCEGSSELAAAWIVEDRDAVLATVKGLKDREAAVEAAEAERARVAGEEAAEAICRARAVTVPTAVEELGASLQLYHIDEEEKKEDAVVVTAGGHRMVPVDGKVGNCILCAETMPGKFCGYRKCQFCQLCEGCVDSGVTFACPSVANGGHLYDHPLLYRLELLRRKPTCSVCRSSTLCPWNCELPGCEASVCIACMAQPRPKDYGRHAGSVSEEQKEASRAVSNASFDDVAAERGVAARWEGSYLFQEPAVGDVIVGSGTVGTTITDPPSSRQRTATRLGISREDADVALSRFRDSGGDDANAAELTAHVEHILDRAKLVSDRLTARALCEAIAAGRIETAGTLLLSRTYAPIPPKQKGDSGDSSERARGDTGEEEELRCWCGDVINATTAPDGAVGCLGGHAMHASCAADLLLGGGQCPSCRQPLYFPRLPGPETKSAVESAKGEIAKARREAEEREGHSHHIAIGDTVRLSPDVKLCLKRQTEDPRAGGWQDDMAPLCGRTFRVVRLVEEGGCVVGVETLPIELRDNHSYVSASNGSCSGCHRGWNSRNKWKCSFCSLCQRCCLTTTCKVSPEDGHVWRWSPSLLSPVITDREEVAARAAERHLVRLRAELAAVKAAREDVRSKMESSMPDRLGAVERELSGKSAAAVRAMAGNVSPADWNRARHLLSLARNWGDSEEARAKRATLYSSVRAGDLDSVARSIRRHNANRMIEAARWADAVLNTSDHIVEPTTRVDLYAFPLDTAPKTGYSLEPKERFKSEREVLDRYGNMWVKVSESSFVDFGKLDGKVFIDKVEGSRLIGARVRKGPDYRDDGIGEVTEGVITKVRMGKKVSVEWDNRGGSYTYRAGEDDKYDLEFVRLPPAPPQGWCCVRPGGLGSPAVVARARSALRCFSCGDGLSPPKFGEERFSAVDCASVKKGDRLFVAATLEPVIVESSTAGRIYCSFPIEENEKEEIEENESKSNPGVKASQCFDTEQNENVFDVSEQPDLVARVWFRPEDLVCAKRKSSHQDDDNEIVMVMGKLRTRRELFLFLRGDEDAARTAWEEAQKKRTNTEGADSDVACFASCARGHLLHARCLQGALLAGRSCPAAGCNEPLWVPKVSRARENDTECCGRDANGEAESEALRAADELAGHAALVATRASAEGETDGAVSEAVSHELKMCPACFAGPLFNENCNDMQAHHGQCSITAMRGDWCSFHVSASEIASKMTELSDTRSVADLLPKCPNHNVLVMFNGCMSCGYLFTDTSWSDMPRWDEKAKSLIELDEKKRNAAELLAKQIRTEAAMLQFERDALWDQSRDKELSKGGRDKSGLELKLKPPPPPTSAHEYVIDEDEESSGDY